MQAPRSLWDYDYLEESWIAEWFSQWLPILPPVKSSINTYYPGTKLAFTEYDYGGQDHYSGGIATADVLGIFGKYGVYIANYWGGDKDANYVHAAFRIYRDYDGNDSTFGDTEVYSTMSNKVDSSIYASVFDGLTCGLHLIVINKKIQQQQLQHHRDDANQRRHGKFVHIQYPCADRVPYCTGGRAPGVGFERRLSCEHRRPRYLCRPVA
jgi:mannan endo-1,4-beta-mannosidase